MPEDLIALDASLRREADGLLRDRGLLALLARYGTPHVTGSYALQLMAWRDLDLYLEATGLGLAEFFALGGEIASALCPVRMSFRNERVARTPGLPEGTYWGVYLGDERQGAWKIDLWAVEPEECRRLLRGQEELARRLTPEARRTILGIKAQVWAHPEYRRSFGSQDVYRAVLDHGVSDTEGFWVHITPPAPPA